MPHAHPTPPSARTLGEAGLGYRARLLFPSFLAAVAFVGVVSAALWSL